MVMVLLKNANNGIVFGIANIFKRLTEHIFYNIQHAFHRMT
jgi:hypothetical protein